SAASRAKRKAPDEDTAPDHKCLRLTESEVQAFQKRAETWELKTQNLSDMKGKTIPACCSYFTTKTTNGGTGLMQTEHTEPIVMRQFEDALSGVVTIEDPNPKKIEGAISHLCGSEWDDPSIAVLTFEHPSDPSLLCVLPMHQTITGGITTAYNREANHQTITGGITTAYNSDATKYPTSQAVYVEEEDEGTD
ncbi:MAG: hypothetical protein P8N43_02665, partial [Alphaproteobacteria bacterium]|nr:hypothetical protein [Alphaproteobacteria bacterium]